MPPPLTALLSHSSDRQICAREVGGRRINSWLPTLINTILHTCSQIRETWGLEEQNIKAQTPEIDVTPLGVED